MGVCSESSFNVYCEKSITKQIKASKFGNSEFRAFEKSPGRMGGTKVWVEQNTDSCLKDDSEYNLKNVIPCSETVNF